MSTHGCIGQGEREQCHRRLSLSNKLIKKYVGIGGIFWCVLLGFLINCFSDSLLSAHYAPVLRQAEVICLLNSFPFIPTLTLLLHAR